MMENLEKDKVVEQPKRKPTASERNAEEIKSLKSDVKNLTDQVSALLAALQAQVSKPVEAAESIEQNVEEKPSYDTATYENTTNVKISATDDITFVHLVQCSEGLRTHVRLTTMELNLTELGETFTLSRAQADEFIGRYRKWFNSGIFAVANDPISIQYSKSKKLKLADEYIFTKYNLDMIGRLDVYELEELYNKIAPAHQNNLISYFKRKVYEACADSTKRDPYFCDFQKLEVLNRLSDDSLHYEIEDLRRLK